MSYREVHVTDAKANLITLLLDDAPREIETGAALFDLQGRRAAPLGGDRFRLSDGTVVCFHKPIGPLDDALG